MRTTPRECASRGSQETDSFAALLARWLKRRGFDASTVKGRKEAGAAIGLSHQSIAEYLGGAAPHPNRTVHLARILSVGEARLRRMLVAAKEEREAHRAQDVASDPHATVDEPHATGVIR